MTIEEPPFLGGFFVSSPFCLRQMRLMFRAAALPHALLSAGYGDAIRLPIYNITRHASTRRSKDHDALAGLVDGKTTASRFIIGCVYRI